MNSAAVAASGKHASAVVVVAPPAPPVPVVPPVSVAPPAPPLPPVEVVLPLVSGSSVHPGVAARSHRVAAAA